MNLFRSEDDVRAWPDFDPRTEKTIKSVREWSGMMNGARLFQRRLDDNFVEKSEEYGNEALSALGEALG